MARFVDKCEGLEVEMYLMLAYKEEENGSISYIYADACSGNTYDRKKLYKYGVITFNVNYFRERRRAAGTLRGNKSHSWI
jgi:hypothetical protein